MYILDKHQHNLNIVFPQAEDTALSRELAKNHGFYKQH